MDNTPIIVAVLALVDLILISTGIWNLRDLARLQTRVLDLEKYLEEENARAREAQYEQEVLGDTTPAPDHPWYKTTPQGGQSNGRHAPGSTRRIYRTSDDNLD